MNADDQTLVNRAQRGEGEAFAQLVSRHQRYVYNLAYRLLRDMREAEDLAQEAFLHAWKGLASFQRKAKFTTWLYRIVVNLCYNRMPGLRRRLLTVDIDDTNLATAPTAANPPAVVERTERKAFLHQQIAALPDKYRLVITLFYLQELSYQEIATVLNLPLGTVKTHLFRAREHLKQLITEKSYDRL